MKRYACVIAYTVIASMLASCASAPTPITEPTRQAVATTPTTDNEMEAAALLVDEIETSLFEDTTVLGSGVFVQSARDNEAPQYDDEDGVTLNFEQADLREFLRVVFETILRTNYLIDPAVNGTVTLHTTRPVAQASVLPTVETVLQLNGAAMIFDDGIYKIMPLADAERASRSPSVGRGARNLGTGYGVQIVPLQYASAVELESILTPLVPEGSTLRIDANRNVLILTGPQFRLEELLATVRTFDVDWLQGMSFAMFRLEYADAVSLVEELDQIIGADGPAPLTGAVRLIPIARLNAVLVISLRPERIADIRDLIDQFDIGVEGSGGRRLFVYELENGKAETIATALQQIFQPTVLGGSFNTLASADDPFAVFNSAESLTTPLRGPQSGSNGFGPAEDEFGGVAADTGSDIKIIADTDNNAILVLSSHEDYRSIEAAIRRLDVAPRQVLIEATIAEVSLADTLDYGVRWFLEQNEYELGFNAPVPGSALGEGLTYAFFDQDSEVTAFFDLLGTASEVKFLSTPQVMVLDNQTANIRVGDQIPVTTRSSQSTVNPDAPIVTEVQFRDTGTLLTVTPRINAGGQVTLEISQEVSLPGTEPAIGGGGNVSIAQRTINSSVIVQSGQTVVLGGLILENTSEGRSGIPGLMRIPGLGKIFSTTSRDVFRTELLVTVKPVVIENQRAMRRVTEELRMRMREASEYEDSVKATYSDQ
jgi:general secretion pathway protein D